MLRAGDWLAVSEKFVTISQGRVIHQSVVRPGWLAKLLVHGVTKHADDVGYSDPRKMQVAIMQAGWLRMFVAMIIGGATALCSAAAATSTASPAIASPRSTASTPRR